MTASIDDLRQSLDDLEMAARHLIARPTNAAARAALKRACERAAAIRNLDAAEARAMDALDPDPRPEPSTFAEASADMPAASHPAKADPPPRHAWQDRADIDG